MLAMLIKPQLCSSRGVAMGSFWLHQFTMCCGQGLQWRSLNAPMIPERVFSLLPDGTLKVPIKCFVLL